MLTIPNTIPGGLVDITLEAAPGQPEHHLVFLRLKDGVAYEEVAAAPNDKLLEFVTIEGGNGSIPAGRRMEMTLDLRPGQYTIVDINDAPTWAMARTTVTAPAGPAPAPVGARPPRAWRCQHGCSPAPHPAHPPAARRAQPPCAPPQGSSALIGPALEPGRVTAAVRATAG